MVTRWSLVLVIQSQKYKKPKLVTHICDTEVQADDMQLQTLQELDVTGDKLLDAFVCRERA